MKYILQGDSGGPLACASGAGGKKVLTGKWIYYNLDLTPDNHVLS